MEKKKTKIKIVTNHSPYRQSVLKPEYATTPVDYLVYEWRLWRWVKIGRCLNTEDLYNFCQQYNSFNDLSVEEYLLEGKKHEH